MDKGVKIEISLFRRQRIEYTKLVFLWMLCGK